MSAASRSMRRQHDRQARDFGPGPSPEAPELSLSAEVIPATPAPAGGAELQRRSVGPMTRSSPRAYRGQSEANDNERVRLDPGGPAPSSPFGSSALPPDAEAVIEPVPVATNQSGRARAGEWRLRFKLRRAPTVDPLTGWTGGADPLAHVTLRFPSREAAERFCTRHGIRFDARRAPRRRPNGTPAKPSLEGGPPLCCWPTGPHALCCGDYPIDRGPVSARVPGKDTAMQE
jgi:hypothetical protein